MTARTAVRTTKRANFNGYFVRIFSCERMWASSKMQSVTDFTAANCLQICGTCTAAARTIAMTTCDEVKPQPKSMLYRKKSHLKSNSTMSLITARGFGSTTAFRLANRIKSPATTTTSAETTTTSTTKTSRRRRLESREELKSRFSLEESRRRALVRPELVLLGKDGDDESARRQEVEEVVARHAEAADAFATSYEDPRTGLRVLTTWAHFLRGRCCGSACRHCVYGHEAVPEEKRGEKRFNSAYWEHKTQS